MLHAKSQPIHKTPHTGAYSFQKEAKLLIMAQEPAPNTQNVAFNIQYQNSACMMKVIAQIYDDHIYCQCKFSNGLPDMNLMGILQTEQGSGYIWQTADGDHPMYSRARHLGYCVLKRLRASGCA